MTDDPAGPLRALLSLPGVTDVLVNAPDAVWIDRGAGLERADAPLGSAADVRSLAVGLAAAAGRRLDDAQPTVDGRLPDGTRLHAVLPPVADGCALISLRRVRGAPLTLADLTTLGMLTQELATVLAGLVATRTPVLVSGGTGAGKTTLLAALLSAIDPGERIVLIEEAGEIVAAHPHVVRLVERRPNVEGAGAVGLDRLLREALRMRPDRIVLGECRGAELREVLAAANTGHRGSLTTMHANDAAAVPARLAALAAMAGLDQAQLEAQARAAFAVVVHVDRGGPRGARRVAQVGLLDGRASTGGATGGSTDGRGGEGVGGLRVVAALGLDAAGQRYGPAWPALRALAGGT